MKTLHFSQFFSILAILLTSSCSIKQAAATPSQVEACDVPIAWEIEFTLSGGFSGMVRSLYLSSNGNVIVEDQQKNEKNESALSQDALGEVQEMLILACPFEVMKDNRLCADCLNYNLRVSMNGRQFILQTNELNIPDNLSPLFRYLNGIITK
ncbi:MAG: hypothetical protein HY864_00385 [Chloroflexi bacterium]|nr:hypothetical protein [Chloroflexota bacterium]